MPRRRTELPYDVDPPLATGLVRVGASRHLDYAEFGDPDGHLVLWLHGTPGSCRQVAPAAKQAAADAGLRLVGIARPGVGRSTRHRHDRVIDVAHDFLAVVDHLGADRFAVVGLSGGGPYALATSVVAGERVAAVAVLGGVAPSVGPDAASGGLHWLLPRLEFLASRIEQPLGWALTKVIRPLTPYGSPIYDGFSRLLPEGDQRVFATPGVKDMFIDDLARGVLDGGMYALLRDAVLFGRDWGYRLADVTSPVHWWHGDADTIVPLSHGEHATRLLPNATFEVRPGDSHLSGYAAAADVIAAVRARFPD